MKVVEECRLHRDQPLHTGPIVHGGLINDQLALQDFFGRGGRFADSDGPTCSEPDASGVVATDAELASAAGFALELVD